jgi:hypothetical protein
MFSIECDSQSDAGAALQQAYRQFRQDHIGKITRWHYLFGQP